MKTFAQWVLVLGLPALATACGSTGNGSGSGWGEDFTQASSQASSAKKCKKTSDCPSGNYCSIASKDDKCETSGTCTATEFVCPQICEPVCGCDGNTYDNYCVANQAGTSVAFDGFCLEQPAVACYGASAGTACTPKTAQSDCDPNGAPGAMNVNKTNSTPSDLYCTLESKCGIIPPDCANGSLQAIGTDGKSYKNDCDAYWVGRVEVSCHPKSGPVCAVDLDKTLSSECAAVNAGQAYSEGPCH